MRVTALIATVPSRKKLCERLLLELTRQTRPPDDLVLVCDGYPDKETTPQIPVTLTVRDLVRSTEFRGCGARWLEVQKLHPSDVVFCIDDDTMVTKPQALEKLLSLVEPGRSAAGAMGITLQGRAAPPGDVSMGDLIFVAPCGLAAYAGDLQGLHGFADELKKAGGPAALENNGSDDALISAFLWKSGIAIHHAPSGELRPLTKSASKKLSHRQKWEIAKRTGWPFVSKHHGKV